MEQQNHRMLAVTDITARCERSSPVTTPRVRCAHHHRKQRVDWRRNHRQSRSHDWEQYRHRLGIGGRQGHPQQRHCSRKPLQGPARDHQGRQTLLGREAKTVRGFALEGRRLIFRNEKPSSLAKFSSGQKSAGTSFCEPPAFRARFAYQTHSVNTTTLTHTISTPMTLPSQIPFTKKGMFANSPIW